MARQQECKEMRLDEAQDRFHDNPCTATAEKYAKTVREYYDDGMIGPDTLRRALREVDRYYITRDNA
jgi:hypothetical protein